MLKRFIAYYKPHKLLFFLDMLASLMISILGMVYPIVTRNMLNDYIPNKKIRIKSKVILNLQFSKKITTRLINIKQINK